MEQLEERRTKEEKKRAKLLKKTSGRDDKGIQTLFKTLSRNHYRLLEMIDRKANILLSVNSIIITLIIGTVVLKRKNTELTVETLHSPIMIIFCVLSMIFAIMAISPNRFPWSRKSVREGNLFHGAIVQYRLDDFQKEIERLLENGKSLYNAITLDIYYLSKQISIKERSIRLSLMTFIIGIVLATISYLYFNLFVKFLL